MTRRGLVTPDEREQMLRAFRSEGNPMPPTACPACGHEFDRATKVLGNEPGEPKPGDVTLCLVCASALRFTEGLGVEPLDFSTVGDDLRKAIKRVQRTIIASKARPLT